MCFEDGLMTKIVRTGHGSAVLCAVSIVGTVFTGGGDGFLVQWDSKLHQLRVLQLLHAVLGVASFHRCSGDDSRLIVGTVDSDVFELDASSAEATLLTAGHGGTAIVGVCVVPASGLVATADDAGGLRLWKHAERLLVAHHQLSERAYSLCVSPDGSMLAVGCRGKVQLLSAKTLDPEMSLHVPVPRREKSAVCMVQFAPDATRRLLAGVECGAVVMLTLKQPQQHQQPALIRAQSPSAAAATAVGTTGAVDDSAVRWSSMLAMRKRVRGLDWSSDATLVRAWCPGVGTKIWNAKTGQLLSEEEVTMHVVSLDSRFHFHGGRQSKSTPIRRFFFWEKS